MSPSLSSASASASSLSRIAFLRRTRPDQLLAFSRVVHVMERVLVLKHWHDARAAMGSGPEARAAMTLLEEACIDSSLLAIRALDMFFATRPTSHGAAHEEEVYADLFGYTHGGGFLSKERRRELAGHIGHVTTLPSSPAFHSSLREDLIKAAAPSLHFLAWMVGTDFLDGELALRDAVEKLVASFRSIAEEHARSTQAGRVIEVSEDVVKATAACLRAAKSPYAVAFTTLVKGATLMPAAGTAVNGSATATTAGSGAGASGGSPATAKVAVVNANAPVVMAPPVPLSRATQGVVVAPPATAAAAAAGNGAGAGVRPATGRVQVMLGQHGTLAIPGGVEDLDRLLGALHQVQTALGETSESVRILNWLQISWAELRRKMMVRA